MIKLPRDFGRKFLKGLNLVEHYHDLVDLREFLRKPWLILLGGTIFAMILRALGVWTLLDTAAASMSPLFLLNSKFVFVSLLPLFYFPYLAREILMSRARRDKSGESYGCYLWRYSKGMLFMTLSGVLYGVFIGLFIIGNRAFATLYAEPKTVLNVLLLSGVVCTDLLLLCGLFCFFVLSFALCLYGVAFVLQGYSLRESTVRGIKLFKAHWIYPVTLSLSLIGLPSLVRYVLVNYVPGINTGFLGNAFVRDIGMYCLQLSGLMYYALFLSYHKRVSRTPSAK